MDQRTQCRLDLSSLSSRIGRSALAVAMAGMMAASALAVPTGQAYAADGTVTIQATSANQAPNTYKVYQVFVADIDAENNATHIEWNNANKAATLTFLNANGYPQWLTDNGHTQANAAENPQNALEFIASKVNSADATQWDSDAATTPATPSAASFANNLAQALAANSPTGTATAGTAFTGAEGFYLFVSNDDNVANKEAGTAAIWVPLGGSVSTITEKNAVPTVNKQVVEDSTAAAGKAADANRNQDVDFVLTGTMPSNIGAFETYHYMFADTLPSGMTLKNDNVSSVAVSLDGNDITSSLTGAAGSITWAGNVLNVNIADLVSLASGLEIPLTKDSVVTVDYKASLNAGSNMGSAGNENEVELTYTADPVSLQDKAGLKSTAKTYTYRLKVVKADKQTGEPVAGAKYTMQVTNTPAGAPTYEVDNLNGTYYLVEGEYVADEPAGYTGDKYVQVPGSPAVANPDNGKYVQQDGSLGASPYKFTTGADGSFTIPRIDEGRYVIAETDAASGYELQDADIVVTVTSDLNQTTGALTSLSATVSGGEATQKAATDVITHLATSADTAKYVVGAPNAETGEIGVVTSNDKKITLPVTGMDGVTAALLGGIGAIAIGSMTLMFTRKRKEEGEEA